MKGFDAPGIVRRLSDRIASSVSYWFSSWKTGNMCPRDDDRIHMKTLRLRDASVRAVRLSVEENDLQKAAEQQFLGLHSFYLTTFICLLGHTHAKIWHISTLRTEFPPLFFTRQKASCLAQTLNVKYRGERSKAMVSQRKDQKYSYRGGF